MSTSQVIPEAAQETRDRLIHGTGEMARLIREKDWSRTPLGPLETWPESMLATVNLALAAADTFAIYWGDEQVLIYNDEYRKLLHEKHPAALGGCGKEVWQEAWTVIGPQICDAYERGVTTKITEALIPILVGGVMQDGWYSYSFHPLYARGEIVGVGNPGRDDTASVMARMALQESEERLSQVLGATTDAVLGVDREWKISYLNAAAEKSYGSAQALVGRVLWACFPEALADGAPFLEHYSRAMYDGIAGSFETHYPAPLNMWIQLEVYPTKDGIVTFSRDITAQRVAHAALLQNEKLAAVGRLASSIAHEINNPLEAVTNLLYLARLSEDLSEIKTYLSTADGELRRTSVIANQTLRFHKQATRPVPATCDELIGTVLGIHQARILNAGVRVEKRKRAVSPVTCFDGEIRQVLSNLVGNALDAMSASGGRLLVRSREGHDWKTGQLGLMITVADTGTGMSRETVAKLFDAFFTTKGIGGTGLGLWISKEIVERHRGRLLVRSRQGSRGGTVFIVFLPFDVAGR